MKTTLSSLLKNVFLSSLAGILAKEGRALDVSRDIYQSDADNSEVALLESSSNLQPKLLLRKIDNEGWNIIAHRSHRSHSSHRSHYSHYSSSSRGSSKPRSSGSSSSSRGSSSSGSDKNTVERSSLLSSPSGVSANPSISATALKLGARTLKRGMSGTDVTELINILLQKKYLKLEDGGTRVVGSYAYDETIEATVKQFQVDNGMKGDGICGPLTIYYLKKTTKDDN